MNVGSHFVPHQGVWYLFHREYGFMEPQPSYCVADYARVVVRTSTDKGLTWSNATVVAQPPLFSDDDSATPQAPDECAIVDGAGYFDGSSWHYLGQCLNRTRHWNLCHYSTLEDADPLDSSSWSSNPKNPVVHGGELWGVICANSTNCPPVFHDEGTPEIVSTDPVTGEHYVTFHGCNDDATVSARGVARTNTNFTLWETSGEGLPNDAIFGQQDCNLWDGIQWANGTCVGGGEGSIIDNTAEDGYMYQLIEAPDKSLGCLGTGQNWVLGLVRSKTFSPAGTWERFPGAEPTIVPVVVEGCYIQYHRIFSDDEGTYLEYWVGDNEGWMYIHELVAGGGDVPIVVSQDD